MRQFNFFYTSYMKNEHGLLNMMPHAKMFHPYAGLDGTTGQTMWRTKSNPFYGTEFLYNFVNKTWKFQHKIKLFFPEIRHGLLLAAGIKYSNTFNPDDDVTISHTILKGDNYNEYIEINDFTAIIDIEVEVKFGKHGLSYPGEITCDFVDIYLFDQKISLITHVNTLKFVPYYLPYQTDFPFELARHEADYTNLTSNSERKFGFVIPIESKEAFEDMGFKPTEVSTELLKIDSAKNYMRDIGNFNGEKTTEVADMFARQYKKYLITFPMNLFPRNGELGSKIPIFDSEKCMKCCGYNKMGGGNILAKDVWDTFAPTVPDAEPSDCVPDSPCDKEVQYEVRSKLVNSFMRMADLTWDRLDELIEVREMEESRTNKKPDVTPDEFDKIAE